MNLKQINRIEVEQVADVISYYFGINPEVIFMRDMKKKPTMARQITCYILHQYYGYTSMEIQTVISKQRMNVMRNVKIIMSDLNCKNEETTKCINYAKTILNLGEKNINENYRKLNKL